MKETKEDKPITLKYTKEEIAMKAQQLEQDEEVTLFLKFQNGARKYEELTMYYKILEEQENKK